MALQKKHPQDADVKTVMLQEKQPVLKTVSGKLR